MEEIAENDIQLLDNIVTAQTETVETLKKLEAAISNRKLDRINEKIPE